MSNAELFKYYRRMVASPNDGEICWWYFGTTYVLIPGYPQIPVINAAAAMFYRSTTLSDTEFVIDWREVGYFSDIATARITSQWQNPLTGERVEPPRTFEEGPGQYTVALRDDAIVVGLRQPAARVDSIRLDWTLTDGNVSLLQTERKVRGFPLRDGSLPSPDSEHGFETQTELAFHVRRADLSAGDRPAPALGIYRFDLSGIPAWMGFQDFKGTAYVTGLICKSAVGEAVNSVAYDTLKQLFPHAMP